jgi:hypothetical protein
MNAGHLDLVDDFVQARGNTQRREDFKVNLNQ